MVLFFAPEIFTCQVLFIGAPCKECTSVKRAFQLEITPQSYFSNSPLSLLAHLTLNIQNFGCSIEVLFLSLLLERGDVHIKRTFLDSSRFEVPAVHLDTESTRAVAKQGIH